MEGAPRLGLMTTDLPAQRGPRKGIGTTWQILADAGAEAGTPVLFFHPHRADLGRRRAQGFLLQGGVWRFGTWPLPRVIVDNVFVHVARTDRIYAAAKRAMERAGLVVLNPRLPDKRGVWEALRAFAPLAAHLPETAVLTKGNGGSAGSAQLDSWLERHPSVFFKPVRGSGGRGVICVRKRGDGRYEVFGKERAVKSRDSFSRLLRERLRGEAHLMQQGLSLVEADGCRIDLRTVLHRDGHGAWQAVTTVPRLGTRGQVVTNLAQGGQVRTLEWLCERCSVQGVAMPSRESLEQVAVQAAEAVTRIRPTLAFLGIDIALDEQGRVWVLDVNPRPGRKVLGAEERKAAFRHLVAFSRTL